MSPTPSHTRQQRTVYQKLFTCPPPIQGETYSFHFSTGQFTPRHTTELRPLGRPYQAQASLHRTGPRKSPCWTKTFRLSAPYQWPLVADPVARNPILLGDWMVRFLHLPHAQDLDKHGKILPSHKAETNLGMIPRIQNPWSIRLQLSATVQNKCKSIGAKGRPHLLDHAKVSCSLGNLDVRMHQSWFYLLSCAVNIEIANQFRILGQNLGYTIWENSGRYIH